MTYEKGKNAIQEKYLEFLECIENKPGDEIPKALEEIEELIFDVISGREYLQRAYINDRDRVGRKILKLITGDSKNIPELLDDLNSKVKSILIKSPEEIDRELGIYVKHLDGVILPPGEGNIQEGEGKSQNREEKEITDSRYGIVLGILRVNDIYADDITVYSAKLIDTQRRKTSYRVIQIPSISKTIFVCDEYGEASFVCDSLVYPEVFLESNKSEIRERLGASRVVHSDGWEERMIEGIFGETEKQSILESAQKRNKKVSMKELDEYREEVLRQFPTVEEFMLFNHRRAKTSILGAGFTQLGNSIFNLGLNYPLSDRKELAVLGAYIYGTGYDIIDCEFWDIEQWSLYIKSLYPNISYWINLPYKKKQDVTILGKGMTSLLSIFKIKNSINRGDRIDSFLKIVYEDGDFELEYKDFSIEQWKQKIKNLYPLPKDFVLLTQDERSGIKLFGFGLNRLCNSIFGCSNLNPLINRTDLAHFAQIIYGKGHDVIDCEFWSYEEWKEKLLVVFPTRSDYLGIYLKGLKDTKILGRGMHYVFSRFLGFDLENGQIQNRDRFKLAEVLYGGKLNYLDFTEQEWKDILVKEFGDKQNFLSISGKKMAAWKYEGMVGMRWIASNIYGIHSRNLGSEKNNISILSDKIFS